MILFAAAVVAGVLFLLLMWFITRWDAAVCGPDDDEHRDYLRRCHPRDWCAKPWE
jgi:hypothetical protein